MGLWLVLAIACGVGAALVFASSSVSVWWVAAVGALSGVQATT